jgi:hypothetical protein
LGAGCFVPAPPSDRGPAGRDRWLIAPRHHRLPAGWTVAAALILAAERVTACDRQLSPIRRAAGPGVVLRPDK